MAEGRNQQDICVEKERKQLSLNLALHTGQRGEGFVTEGFRGFRSLEDDWLEFLRGHPMQNQKYFLAKIMVLAEY